MTEEDERLADELGGAVEFIRRMGRITRNVSLDFSHRKQAMEIQQIIANEAVSQIEKSANQSNEIATKVFRKEPFMPVRFSPRKSVIAHNVSLAESVSLNADSALSFSPKKQTERLFYEIDFIVRRVVEFQKWYGRKLTAVNKELSDKALLNSNNSDPQFVELFHPFVRETIREASRVFPSVVHKKVYQLYELPSVSMESIPSWIEGIRIICDGNWLIAKQSFSDICLRVDKEAEARIREKELKLKETFFVLPNRATHWGEVIKQYDEELREAEDESERERVRLSYRAEPNGGTHLPEFVESYQKARERVAKKPTAADMKRHWNKALKEPLASFLRGKK